LFDGPTKFQLYVNGDWPPFVDAINSHVTGAFEGATHGVLSARHDAVNIGTDVVVVLPTVVVVATDDVVVVVAVTLSPPPPPHAASDTQAPRAVASPIFVIVVSSAAPHTPRPVPCP
jgi:hypothetical protein